MKTGRFKDRITITVKVSVGCDEPWPPPTEDKTKLAVLQGLRATLQIIGESYESEILSKVQAQLGEPDNWRNLSDLDGWHQRNNWPNPIAAMASVLEPDIKRRAEEIANIMIKNIGKVKDEIKEFLSHSSKVPTGVTHKVVQDFVERVLKLIGEPDEYLTPPNLDLTHRPVDWRPLPPSEWGQDEVESMVEDLRGARRQLKSILNLSEEDSSDVILKGIHHAAEEALAYIGDDK